MTPSPHSLVRVAAVLFCLCFLAACRSDSRAAPHEGDQVSDSGDSFKGEPRVTADVHYATAQVFESKIATRGANGTRPDAKNVAQLQNAALNQYAAGLKLDPQHTPCLHRSASLLSSMGRHEQALAMWQRYVTATGRTPSSLVNLGLANELAEQPDAAEKAYREATQLDPSHKPAHVNLGLLLAKQGQLQPAQAALSTVLSPAATHWHMGVALQAAGRTKDADQHFRAAAALDPAYAKRPAPPADQSARIE